MTSTGRMHAETFALLRHIEVHGPRSKVELARGLQQADSEVVRRLANLMMLGYLAVDETTRPPNFALTGKARIKLADRNAVYAPAPPKKQLPKKAREAATPALSAAKVARVEQRARPSPLLVTRRARTVVGAELSAPYRASEYAPCTRPGAHRAFTLPSRVGDTLRYRDGRITDMDGNPLT